MTYFSGHNSLNILQAEIGANAMLAVSIAACKAGAAEKEACSSSLITC